MPFYVTRYPCRSQGVLPARPDFNLRPHTDAFPFFPAGCCALLLLRTQFINGTIWANIWLQNLVVVISPKSGRVLRYVGCCCAVPVCLA